MKYNNIIKQKYSAPVADVVELVTESFMMISGLEDYGDNHIFSVPSPDPSKDFIIL